MKLIIFGATGSVGRHLVSQALSQGHEVTAFARTPGALEIDGADSAPTVVKGDVLDAGSVEGAVAGHDAVICALGAGRKGGVRSVGTRNIVRAMENTGVKRLICQSTLGVGDSAGNLNFFWKHVMFGWLLKKAFADHVEQEAYVRESDLDWVIVRPAAFTDGPVTGEYKHGFASTDEGLTLKISRADVAHFILGQLEDDTYLRRTPGLSY
jgi:putative NADH-flavin reductase